MASAKVQYTDSVFPFDLQAFMQHAWHEIIDILSFKYYSTASV